VKFLAWFLGILVGLGILGAIITQMGTHPPPAGQKGQAKAPLTPAQLEQKRTCTEFAGVWVTVLRNHGYNLRLGLPSDEEPGTVTIVGDEIDRAFVNAVVSDRQTIAWARRKECTQLRFWQGLGTGQRWEYELGPPLRRTK
jgi:hypothetical protein